MKLTFITDEATQQPEEFIALARKHGSDAVELRTLRNKHVSNLDADERALLASQLRDAGLGVCCIDSPVFKSSIHEDHEVQYVKLGRALDAAAYFVAPLVLIFSFWR